MHIITLILCSIVASTWHAPASAHFLHEWTQFNKRMWAEFLRKPTESDPIKQLEANYSNLTLADIRGTIPQEIYDLRDFLRGSQAFIAAGAQTPKGVLLVGLPGTGKTSLVRALAGELGIPFLTASGAEFIEMYVGVGPQRVRELFERARTLADQTGAKHVIIFIDELDALGNRDEVDSSETRRTINELLVQMDGFTEDRRIVVIAATNRAELIDSALRRPGRFDYVVSIPLPNYAARLDILTYYIKDQRFNRSVDGTINYVFLAQNTGGFSGADLESLVNRAAINAGRNKRTSICQDDLAQALASMQDQKFC